nr:hypothetical protein [uncultured Sphingomonas sp.]
MKFGTRRAFASSTISLLLLSGCTTFSFAPPTVQTDYKVNKSQAVCAPQAASTDEITHDFRGARNLIDNFTSAYRCSVAEAADGRQIFEVPSFLALVTAALGPTFGLHDDGRIAAVASAAVLGRANSYYAPREKLPALDAALDAVLCVKTETVGVAFFDTRQGDAESVRAAVTQTQQQITGMKLTLAALEAKRATAVGQLKALASTVDASSPARTALIAELTTTEAAIRATVDELTKLESALALIVDPATRIAAAAPLGIAGVTDGPVIVSAHEQYFEMVSGALLSIERVLAARLKSMGKYDAGGLQAEIAKTIEDMRAADAKLRPVRTLARLADADQIDEVQLRVAAIQPRLQGCVLRAKLG